MAWVTGSLPRGGAMRRGGFAILRTARLRISRRTGRQLSTAAGQGKESMMSSLPIRHVLGPILTAPLLAACAGAYPPPGPGVIEFANPYQFAYEAPGFNPDFIRAADYTRPEPSGVAPPPRFVSAGDAGDFDFDHDLTVAAGGYVIGRTGERLIGRAFKPAASAMTGGSSSATPLGTGRMMGWEMLAADGAPAAAAGRTAMSGAGAAADKAAGTAGTAAAAESAAARGALSAGTREAAAVTARTALGTAGRAGAAEAATAGRTALTVGRAAGVARTAMGAGAVLEAGAAVGAAEVLVGAAVIAGSAYVAYKLYESYREGKKTPSTP